MEEDKGELNGVCLRAMNGGTPAEETINDPVICFLS